ncbi:SH3 domain protein [Trypanosoma cruzi]|nr:SH3 domain protein [Trypanosoma cruzi]
MPPPLAVPHRRRAEPPLDISNCPTPSPRRAKGLVRQRSPTVVRRCSGTPAAGRRREEGERGGSGIVCDVGVGAEKVAGGRPTASRRTREQPNKEASRAAFSMAIDAAPPTRPQDARMPRPMSQMNRTPLGVAVLGLRKIAARSETKRTRPLKRKRRIHSSAAGPKGSDGLPFDLRG